MLNLSDKQPYPRPEVNPHLTVFFIHIFLTKKRFESSFAMKGYHLNFG